MKKTSRYLLIVSLFLCMLAYFLPWKNMLETRLKAELAARGFEHLEFNIETVSLNEIIFNNVAFAVLALPKLSISYTPYELFLGNFSEIHANEVTINKDKLAIKLQGVDVNFVSHGWQIKNINITDAPVPLPTLAGGGQIEFADNEFALSGGIFSADKKTNVGFKFDYSLNNSKSAILKIISAVLPWNQGILSAQNISVPLYSDLPISFTLKVKQVSLNELLAATTSNRATATGVVSGSIPITINRDGSFIIKKGDLRTEEGGVLKISPDVIPSDAEQVALLRAVLKDFHYSTFVMGVETADSKKLSMLLSLEGNNPDVYNGRVVKLNVHLTGDVVELIKQSLNILK